MGVDVFLAVGLGVAVQQVFDAVQQPPGPGAKDDAVHFGAVLYQHTQQVHQVGCAPVSGNEGFGKTYVTRFKRRRAHIPVVQVQRCVGQVVALAKALHAAVGQLQGERTVAQVLEQTQYGAGGCRSAAGDGEGGRGGRNGIRAVHGVGSVKVSVW